MTDPDPDPLDELVVDVLVLGGGMAGLTVAASLAQQGIGCAVVEAGPQVGGSAGLSEGYVWTAPDADAFLAQDPTGNVDRFRVMRDGLESAVAWVAELGVEVGPPIHGVLDFGAGRQIDVRGYAARCISVVEAAGGFIIRGTRAVSAERSADGQALTVTIESTVDGLGRVTCTGCVLATGGFQASAARRAQWLSQPTNELEVRSNPFSDGGGIDLGLSLGGRLSKPADGFYGHLIPWALPGFGPADFGSMAQLYSEHGILVAPGGERFVDESLGDHLNANAVTARGRAVLLIDERVRREQVAKPFLPGMAATDRMAAAGQRGANYAVAQTWPELAGTIGGWGYDAAGVSQTVAAYNDALAAGAAQAVPRTRHRAPLVEPPFAALEVQAAITFTYRGLLTDLDGRVLGADGPVRGLYAAGIDAGDLNHRGYTGGLVRGLVLGRRAAATIVDERRPAPA